PGEQSPTPWSTSAISRASATCTRLRRCFCAESTPGDQCPMWRIWKGSPSWPAACWPPTVVAGVRRPRDPCAVVTRTGYSNGQARCGRRHRSGTRVAVPDRDPAVFGEVSGGSGDQALVCRDPVGQLLGQLVVGYGERLATVGRREPECLLHTGRAFGELAERT